jgi:hypothetical protein
VGRSRSLAALVNVRVLFPQGYCRDVRALSRVIRAVRTAPTLRANVPAGRRWCTRARPPRPREGARPSARRSRPARPPASGDRSRVGRLPSPRPERALRADDHTPDARGPGRVCGAVGTCDKAPPATGEDQALGCCERVVKLCTRSGLNWPDARVMSAHKNRGQTTRSDKAHQSPFRLWLPAVAGSIPVPHPRY